MTLRRAGHRLLRATVLSPGLGSVRLEFSLSQKMGCREAKGMSELHLKQLGIGRWLRMERGLFEASWYVSEHG